MKNETFPSRFRSTLLQPAPLLRKWGDRTLIIPRIVVVSIVVFLVTGFIILVKNQAFPKNGLGYFIYWVHDIIYLGLKGITFTLLFPYSLIWYSILLGALLLITVSFLMDRSFLVEPHAILLRALINQPATHRLLFWATREFQKIGITSELLRLTIAFERDLLALRLLSDPLCKERGKLSRLLAASTALMVKVESLFTHWSGLPLATVWEESFLLIMLCAEQESKKESEACQRSLEVLMSALACLYSEIGVKKTVWLCENTGLQPFETEALLRDLARAAWLSLRNNEKREKIFALFMDFKEHPHGCSNSLLTALVVRSIDSRRYLLERNVDDLSRSSQSRNQRSGALQGIGDNRILQKYLEIADRQPDAPLQTINLFETPDAFNLSVLLAFHVALLVNNDDLGLAFYDAFDALTFTLKVEKSNSPVEAIDAPVRIPFTKFARLAARFQARSSEKILPTARKLIKCENSLLIQEDLFLMEENETIYQQIAGPRDGILTNSSEKRLAPETKEVRS